MDSLLPPMVVLIAGAVFAGYRCLLEYRAPSTHPMAPTVPRLRAVLWLSATAFFTLSLWMLARGLIVFAVIVTLCALIVSACSRISAPEEKMGDTDNLIPTSLNTP
ncbi:hypothetical protein M0E82_03980 [Corynebacterium sp. P7202]|uniref:Uncharacterized protein n=1 Tax=Corynebacterium pygosceleis TaxID=2800406 RepID=A0A9Q4CA25_9CORY|nr:hypothetical protein [Corynebacterium pygosceleis]MCK7637165.1 hypothetical protein [Corynebacterium pygosceleis]MCX7445068.1 hypothetical protein [Corynebacterium pygosceleis]MCX7469420.1 hypothetical protein [Corynebacterium pygosceleis]